MYSWFTFSLMLVCVERKSFDTAQSLGSLSTVFNGVSMSLRMEVQTIMCIQTLHSVTPNFVLHLALSILKEMISWVTWHPLHWINTINWLML